LMHSGESIPVLHETSGMQAVLLEITSKRLGCVGFINDKGVLTGILTDGDLRRCLSASILEEKAVNIMTKNPKVVTPDMLASEALKIMNTKKITNLFAVDSENKPVGVIHIHDLLTNGIV